MKPNTGGGWGVLSGRVEKETQNQKDGLIMCIVAQGPLGWSFRTVHSLKDSIVHRPAFEILVFLKQAQPHSYYHNAGS